MPPKSYKGSDIFLGGFKSLFFGNETTENPANRVTL